MYRYDSINRKNAYLPKNIILYNPCQKSVTKKVSMNFCHALHCWSRAEIATQSRIEITNLGRLEIANAAADSFL